MPDMSAMGRPWLRCRMEGLRIPGRVRDLGISGCFVESASINRECGTQVEVYFETEWLHFRVAGNVTVLRKV